MRIFLFVIAALALLVIVGGQEDPEKVKEALMTIGAVLLVVAYIAVKVRKKK